jgi:23S rRNA (cytidine1920-2'-O)/16S rRNA (cytidine1409-2'-O)-methyltransferase
VNKIRLDYYVHKLKLAETRSQAENAIKLGYITVDGVVITKPGYFVRPDAYIKSVQSTKYVSRAGLKLASVAEILNLNFKGKTVLDVGSSTGGFTDYALQHGAKKVYAVDVGTEQLHPSLRSNPKVELHEKTNILDVRLRTLDAGKAANSKLQRPTSNVQISVPEIVVIDVSFVSLRDLLPHIATLCGPKTQIVAMVKPQFEAGAGTRHKGVIKNDAVRREILKSFEIWAKQYFVIGAKADSDVTGAKGNRERFYLLAISK